MRVLQNKCTYKCHCQENRIVHHSSIAFIMAPKSGLSKFKPTIETRTRNKMIHPGQVVNDAKQKRTSHEEMEKICAEETRMQYEKELDQVESIQKQPTLKIAFVGKISTADLLIAMLQAKLCFVHLPLPLMHGRLKIKVR